MKWSQELWVDGPNAQLDNNNSEVDNTICYHEEKQHRIQQWIQQHTKHIWSDFPSAAQTSPTQTQDSAYSSGVKQVPRQKASSPEMLDVSCQTDLTPSGSTVTPSESEWSFEDPLKVLSDDEIFGIERIAGAGREAMSDCCDNEYLLNSGFDDMDDCHSEPITEPPKQLKLEQFLQQLTTITMPRIHHHQHRDHRKDLEYRSLRHPDGASDHNLSISQWELPKPDFTEFSTFSYSSAKEVVKSPTPAPRPLSATSPPPTSSPNEPLFITSSPNHAVLPTSPRVNRLLGSTTVTTSAHSSPSKSSISRKQQKIEQQLKRNTTSTTTSGHGTTSEGECSSVAKKTSSVSSPSFMSSHHQVVQRQPASSGYESTIHDDDSDRELVTRRPEIGATIIESVGGTPVKMRSKKSEITKDDKNRLSTSSDRCSFLCCKFMKFYH